jgi:hypothetical protein
MTRESKKKTETRGFLELYAMLDGWTEREAVLLSLNRDPRRPLEDDQKNTFYSVHKIPGYEDRMFMIVRAVVAFGWHGYILPSDFVRWATSKGLSLPEGLVRSVDKIKHDDGFEIRLQNPNAIENREKSIDDELMRDCMARELEYLRGLQTEDAQKMLEERIAEQLHPKARTSLLKLIAGMAVDKFRFDPGKANTETASKIQSALQRAGLSIDDDTVRKWLVEAGELIRHPK